MLQLSNLFRFSFCLLLMVVGMGLQLSAQGFQTDFGKNRVQFHDFEWSFYETENFIVYFYQGGQDLAKFALQVGEDNLAMIEGKLEHQLSNKIELMIYHNNSDVRQTNIGQGVDFSNSGGVTQIVGNKVFVYYNGDHQHLKKQLIEGIAKVHFESLVFGSSLQEIIQNAVLLNLPEWFTSGLISYIAEDWNVELDDQLREVLQDEKFKKFNHLLDEEARFAGHALWNYIAENYGESDIPNILYLTRINRSVESGFLFVLGSPVKAIIDEWWENSQKRFENHEVGREAFQESDLLFKTKKTKRNVTVDRVQMSPDGKYLAYTTNEKGLLKVFIRDTETGNVKKILKTGFKNHNLPIGHTYPLLAWNKSSKKLAVIYDKRDEIRLLVYNTLDETKEQSPITKFQQVLDVDFTDDDRRIILSAVKNGQGDLYSYFIPNTRVTQLTNDFYDDLDIDFVKMGDDLKGIVFRSNRTNDTLTTGRIDSIMPTGNFDIFFYDLNKQSNPLVQLTNTPFANEKLPAQYNDNYFSYLSDENGIYNRFVVAFDTTYIRTDEIVYFKDSTVYNPTFPIDSLMLAEQIDSIVEQDVYKISGKSQPITNSVENLLFYDISPKKNKIVEVEKGYRQYHFYERTLNDTLPNIVLQNTFYQNQREQRATLGKDFNRKRTKKATPASSAGVIIEEQTLEGQTTESEESEATSEEPSDKIDTDNYFFQSEFEETEETPETEMIQEEITEDGDEKKDSNRTSNTSIVTISNSKLKKSKLGGGIKRSRVQAYAPKFAIDYLAGQLDNSILPFGQYQPYQNTVTGYVNPNLKSMIRFGTSDLFEDYKLTGGFRVPFSGFDHTEYFVNYKNLKKQLDKGWTFYRSNEKMSVRLPLQNGETLPAQVKNIINYLQYTMSCPLDITSRIAAHIGYRHHKNEVLSSDILTLGVEPFHEQWLQTKLEYVFDNTFQVTTNVLNGMRYKVYAEFHKPFQAIINDADARFSVQDMGYLGIIGADFRHYQKVHRQIVWANRLSFAKSFGSRKMLYFLGAVDNWLTLSGNLSNKQDRRFDYTAPINPDGTANYGFQSLTSHLRGFKFNVRNGSNYVLWNSELRVPIFTYLFDRPIKSQFFRDFQVIGLVDAGTAWEVGNPFSEENRYYTYTYPIDIENSQQTPVVARVRYFKNPIVLGYGWGLRTSLLGYYVKFDWAWGLDSGHRNEGMRYLSLGMDF